MFRQNLGRCTILVLSMASLSAGVMAKSAEKLQSLADADRLQPIKEVKLTEPEVSPTPKPIVASPNIHRIASVINGRLSFNSKQVLAAKINELKKLSRENLEAEFLDLYKKGFRSASPLYNETSEQYREEFEAKLAEKIAISAKYTNGGDADFDDDDYLIGDEVFSALLNENREIIVGGLIYHYSVQGIFSSRPSDISTLYAHLKSLPEVDENALAAKYSSSQASGSHCQDGYTPKTISNGVTHYLPKPCANKRLAARTTHIIDHSHVTPAESEPCGEPNGKDKLAVSARQLAPSTNNCQSHAGSTSSSSGSTSLNPSTTTGVDTGQAYLDTLDYCNTKNATFPFFGTVKKCISKFSSKHRVKTRFWDQNYLVYKSIGVQVKNQKKSALIWWTRSTDEIRLSMKNVTFEYNLPVPNYQHMPAITYAYKDRIFDFGGYVNDFNFNGSTIENMPFNANDIDTVAIFIDLPKFINGLPIPGGIDDINVDIFSHESVNEKIMSTLWSNAKRIGRQVANRDINRIVVAGMMQNKVIVTHMNETYVKMNAKKISQVLDHQTCFKITIGDGGNSGVDFGLDLDCDFYSYKNLRVDMYGLARSGKTWRGSKLKFED